MNNSTMRCSMQDRGVINNRDYAAQIRDFSGLRWGTITPTDVDGCIDWHNRRWVLIELKRLGTELPLGQRLCLERLCDDLQQVKPTLFIIAEHDDIPPGDIDTANAIVVKYRFEGKWHPLKQPWTVKAFIDRFLGEGSTNDLSLIHI